MFITIVLHHYYFSTKNGGARVIRQDSIIKKAGRASSRAATLSYLR